MKQPTKIVLRVYFWIFRKRVVRKISADPNSSWSTVQCVFASSDRVFSGVTGAGARYSIQAEIVDVLANAMEPVEEHLCRDAMSPDPLLSAYCILVLVESNSESLDRLPRNIFQRRDRINFFEGPFSWTLSLGELASLLVARWEESLGRRA